MATYYVGWDVGAWKCSEKGKSCDAIVWAREEGSSSALRSKLQVNEFIGNIGEKVDFQKITVPQILQNLIPKMGGDDDVYIAIDAALGWPCEFMNLLNGKSDYMPNLDEKIFSNRFLYRETERYVYNQTKPKVLPKTTVGDRIGGHSAKIISILKRSGLTPNNEGVWNPQDDFVINLKVLETYPAAVRQVISKETPSTIFEYGNNKRSDYYDAVYCMYIAYKYCKCRRELHCPQQDVSLEGWIWFPKGK